ncbi:MAG: cytochrome c [Alphaproteobacteria bacterium]|nr:cytochrome c [Alphaproteobacteria bacterium]
MSIRSIIIAALATITAAGLTAAANAGDDPVARGKYLVTVMGCGDCHTPGYFFGKPDMSRMLAGSEVGFQMPGLGVFYGPNLTSDKETGLGNWSAEDIVKAIQTGERPDGRMLAPIMPWPNLAHLTPEDAKAIAAFLKSLPPVKNKAPGPFGVGETPTAFVMMVVPGDKGTAPPAPK